MLSVASTCRSSGWIMWVCKSLFLAVPTQSAALFGLPPCGLWEDSCHLEAVLTAPFQSLEDKDSHPCGPKLGSHPCFPSRPSLGLVKKSSSGNFSGAREEG